jgi:hypothetical protein
VTRIETDRTILRAFGDAARNIMTGPRERKQHLHHERAFVRATDRPTSGNRRNLAYSRAYAHALATAWGL